MVRIALLAVVALATAPQALSYRVAAGPPKAVEGEYSYDFEISGPDTLVRQLVTSNPVLSVNEVRATRKGLLTSSVGIGNTNHVLLRFETADVTGIASGKPFQFNFVRTNPPPSFNPRSDPPRIVSWGLSMGRRNYLIGLTGEYSLIDPNEDADAEATGIMLDAVVRLPQRALKVGETWTSEWTGKRRQAENQATVAYEQTARLESMTDDPAPRARISFTTTGVFNISAARNSQGESTTLEAKGYIVLDTATGLVVESSSAGAITTDLKKPGIKMVRRMSAKLRIG